MAHPSNRFLNHILSPLLCLLFVSPFAGCDRPDESFVHSTGSASSAAVPTTHSTARVTYRYTGFDRNGRPMVEGTLIISPLDEAATTARGTWQLQPVPGRAATDPTEALHLRLQTGSGMINGEKVGKQWHLRLNQMVDNEVVLVGAFAGREGTGRWEYLTDAGVTDAGRFRVSGERD